MPVTDVIQELMIVKGVAPAPGDTNSAEQGLVSLNLLAQEGISGWALDPEEGWNPQIPSLKGGGVWADSAVSSGRQLLSNEEANVVETMQLTVTGDTAVDLATNIARMGRMIQDARDFWATHWQIEPVFIRWFAVGAPGPQFALIYNIEMAIVEPSTWSQNIRDVTITIEREPYWRPIPPGANPKAWTYEFRGDAFSASVASIVDLTDHLLYDTIDNRREWNTTQTAIVKRNYVDIPATNIPGDAPALVCCAIEGVDEVSGLDEDSIMVGRSTKPISQDVSGTTYYQVYTLNAGDGAVGTDTSTSADTTAPASNSSTTGVRTTTTFATASLTNRLSFQGLNNISEALLRGQFSAFLRYRLSTTANVTLQLRYDPFIIGPSVIVSTVVASPRWNIAYLGQFVIPPSADRTRVHIDGKGISVDFPRAPLALYAGRNSGTGNLHVADLFLLPTDEYSQIITLSNNDEWVGKNILFDNTGYFGHGRIGGFYPSTTGTGSTSLRDLASTIQGREIVLEPKVNNRLHFLRFNSTTDQSGINDSSTSSPEMKVRLNIIPRWLGVRDV